MTDWLGSVKDIVSLVADSKAILSCLALISGSVAGVVPRVGLVRALSLGFKRLPILCLSGNLISIS